MRYAHGRQHGLPDHDELASNLRVWAQWKRWARRLAAVLLLSLTAISHSHAHVQYVYDNAGRVVQVIAADSSSAEYQYDAAGNITAINRFSAGQLAFTAFGPSTGVEGTAVTLYGSGFSTTPSANAVSFNGVAATVSAATANQLVVHVPSGATTGPIAVTVAGTSATSAQDFVVGAAPTISGFTPGVVNTGASVTVLGTNFDPVAGSTQVAIGAASGSLSTVSSTQLIFSVPAVARSGAITVRTPFGEAVSASDLIVMPAGIAAADITSTQQLNAGGSAGSLAINQNKYGVFAIHATQGQYLSVQLSSLVTTPSGVGVSYQIYSPSNAAVASGWVAASSNMSVHLPAITATGTYLVVFAAGSASVQLSAVTEINAVFDGSSPPVAMTTAAAWQSKRAVLTAVAGQAVGVGLSGLTLTPNSGWATVSVRKPDGNEVGSVNCSPSNPAGTCGVPLLNLPQTGNYTIQVAPSGATSMNFNLAAPQALTGTLTPGTPQTVNLGLGQFAWLDLAVISGQTVAANVSAITTSPTNQNVWFGIYQTSGTQIVGGGTSTGLTHNVTTLAPGTYKVFLQPYNGIPGTAQISLAAGVPPTLPTDGTASSVSTSVAGQNGYYTFAATAGQNVGVGLSGLTLTPNVGSVSLSVARPDGNQVGSATTCSPASPAGTCGVVLINLPQTGTYTIRAVPSSQTTMNYNLAVSHAVTGTLNSGVPQTVTLGLGQFAWLDFTVTAGQAAAVNIGSITTTPANQNVWFAVDQANGTQIIGNGTSTTLTHNLANLAAGTYKVFVQPYNGIPGGAQVTLAAGITGTLPTDGTSTAVSTVVPGQNAYFTFSATAGQDIGVGLSSLVTTPSSASVGVNVYAPNGALVGNNSCAMSNPGASCNVTLLNLPQTGTYRLEIAVNQGVTASFNVSMSQAVAGSLTAGTPRSLNLTSAGQFAALTFSATAGQTVAVHVSSIVTSPANQNIWFAVFNSSGGPVSSQSSPSSQTFNLTNLAAGTYKVVVAPWYGATATADVTLAAGITATLPMNGTSSSHSTSVPGQNAYFTFAATAGQDVGVGLSSLVTTPSNANLAVSLYAPNGGFLTSNGCAMNNPGASCNLMFVGLPQMGNYLVVVAPPATATASFDVTASPPVSGSLVSGTPQTVNIGSAGQFAAPTFTATAGQSVTVNVNPITTNPANQNLTVIIYNPSGGQVASGVSSTNQTFNLPNLVAGTYKIVAAPWYGALASVQVSYQ